MAVNELLEFDDKVDPKVRMAFIGGKPVAKVPLRFGTKMFKWTKNNLVTPRGISPWWSLVESRSFPNGIRVAGFRDMEERARRLGQTHRDFARVRFAVTQQWNDMSRLLLIELTADVYGFLGKTLGQLEDETVDDVYLIGGEYQLWIPNLTLMCVREISAIG